MKSKIVNAVAALMNFLFGVVVISYGFIATNVERATANEIVVMNQINTITLVILVVVTIANLLLLLNNRHNSVFAFAYVIAILADSFYFFNINIIAIIYLLAALLICIQVLRENVIEKSNTIFMIFLSILIAAIGLFGIYSLTYKDAVEELDEKDNIGQVEYDENFFEYVSELNIKDVYINVEKNGKWGYINQKGQKVIEFKYDYASPFVNIIKNNKNFDVALVCKDGNSYVILKNERTVFSYKNDIDVKDYESQLDKLEEIYLHTFNQEEDFEDNIITCKTDNINKIKAYESGGYLYPFNDDYDISIKISQTGSNNRYELVKKFGSNTKISIDCDNLEFDADSISVYSNGYLPFFKTSEKMQGYYTKDLDRVEVGGNAQILEFYDDNILIKDYNENRIYFMNQEGKILSDKYKDIYVYKDGYIVKKENDKYTLIDKSFKQTIDKEFDFIDTTLIDLNLLICANLPSQISFNSYGIPTNISYSLMDLSGNIITEGFTSIYNLVNKKQEEMETVDYISILTDIKYDFIGERFYNN